MQMPQFSEDSAAIFQSLAFVWPTAQLQKGRNHTNVDDNLIIVTLFATKIASFYGNPTAFLILPHLTVIRVGIIMIFHLPGPCNRLTINLILFSSE